MAETRRQSHKAVQRLLGEEQILRRARGSDTAGNVVHKLRVAADALRVTVALAGKALGASLLYACQVTCTLS